MFFILPFVMILSLIITVIAVLGLFQLDLSEEDILALIFMTTACGGGFLISTALWVKEALVLMRRK